MHSSLPTRESLSNLPEGSPLGRSQCKSKTHLPPPALWNQVWPYPRALVGRLMCTSEPGLRKLPALSSRERCPQATMPQDHLSSVWGQKKHGAMRSQ